MSTISPGHLYAEGNQEAVDFTDSSGPAPMRFQYSPHKLFHCWNCRRRRQARNLYVQCFYDSTRFFCKDKAKCKPKPRKRRGDALRDKERTP